MKIYRFRYRKRVLQGVLKEEYLFPIIGSVFGDFRIGTSPVPIGDVHVLPPVLPSKIIGIGRNYREHAQELGNPLPEEPLIFLKPPSAVIGHLDAVVQPPSSARVDYEGEVGVVIRKKTRQLRDDDPVDELHPRLHLLQRRHGPRPADEGRPVHPGQGIRHLRRRRPLHRDRARPAPGSA